MLEMAITHVLGYRATVGTLLHWLTKFTWTVGWSEAIVCPDLRSLKAGGEKHAVQSGIFKAVYTNFVRILFSLTPLQSEGNRIAWIICSGSRRATPDSFPRNLQGQDEHISHDDNDAIEPSCLRVGYSYHRQISGSQTCPDVFPEKNHRRLQDE